MGIVEAHDAAMHISADIRRRIPNSEVLVHVEPRSHDREDNF
jgi:divalent metal cation (Fe/Co/Zn/Cd) transporter